MGSLAHGHDMQFLELVLAGVDDDVDDDDLEAAVQGVCKFAAEMGSQALEHDMQLLELVLAGVWAWSASRW